MGATKEEHCAGDIPRGAAGLIFPISDTGDRSRCGLKHHLRLSASRESNNGSVIALAFGPRCLCYCGRFGHSTSGDCVFSRAVLMNPVSPRSLFLQYTVSSGLHFPGQRETHESEVSIWPRIPLTRESNCK